MAAWISLSAFIFARVSLFFNAPARSENRRENSVLTSALLVVLLLASTTIFAAAIADLRSADPVKKTAAITELKTQRNQISANALAAALKTEESPTMQLALLDALNMMPEFVPARALAKPLTSTLAPVRKRAAYVTGLVGGRVAEDLLTQRLLTETDPGVKAMLLQSLSICGSARSVEGIKRAMKDSRPEVRAKAKESLQHIPGKEAKTALAAQGER